VSRVVCGRAEIAVIEPASWRSRAFGHGSNTACVIERHL
jgi:hypothetical protein